jgi:hypothetical protein
MATPTTCFPNSFGLPTTTSGGSLFWTGGPVWWDISSGPMPFENKNVDDPRWVGAMRNTFPKSGNGAGEHMSFRGLVGADPTGTFPGQVLFLQWYVKVDTLLNAGATGDVLFVGLWSGVAGQKPFLVRITPFSGGVPPAGSPYEGTTDFGLTFYPGVAGGATFTFPSTGSAPSWLDQTTGYTRIWATTDSPVRWAVNMLVPLSASAVSPEGWDNTGMNLPTNFKLMYQARVQQAEVAMPFDNYHSWPPTLPNGINHNSPEVDPTTWANVSRGGGCTMGISLAQSDFGTANPDPNEILYTHPWWTMPKPVQPVNTIRARPWNHMGSPIPVGGLHAEVQMANWGSLADWDDPTLVAQLWQDVRGGGDFANVNAIADATQVAGNDLSFNWQLNDAELELFDPQAGGTPARRQHNCMRIQLSGQNLIFQNDSVYNNFDVTHASEFEREADINVKTLGSAGGTHRDVFVYVEQTNMPYEVKKAGEPWKAPPPPPEGSVQLPIIPPQEDYRRAVAVTHMPDIDPSKVIVPQGTVLDEWEKQGAPMVRFHVFVDSGERVVDEDGKTRGVLTIMTSFGHAFEHDGPLHGWDAELEGEGLKKIAPNLYHLPVPNEGVATVKTRVVAHEKPRGGCLSLLFAIPVIGPIFRAILEPILNKP